MNMNATPKTRKLLDCAIEVRQLPVIVSRPLASAFSGLSPRTLARAEKAGLLRPIKRNLASVSYRKEELLNSLDSRNQSRQHPASGSSIKAPPLKRRRRVTDQSNATTHQEQQVDAIPGWHVSETPQRTLSRDTTRVSRPCPARTTRSAPSDSLRLFHRPGRGPQASCRAESGVECGPDRARAQPSPRGSH